MKQQTINTIKHIIRIWGYMHYGLSVIATLAGAPLWLTLGLIGFGLMWTIIGSPSIKLLDWLGDL